ncbi:MAG: AmmeMemoRadiSam system protein A [Paracoccaceae bacterium]
MKAIGVLTASRAGAGAPGPELARATSADVSGRAVAGGGLRRRRRCTGPTATAVRQATGPRSSRWRARRWSRARNEERAPGGGRGGFSGAAEDLWRGFRHLNKAGRLRGCIGSLQAHRPLVRDVAENAVKAGHDDPHFSGVTLRGNQQRIRVRVAVLEVPAPIHSPPKATWSSQLRPGEDGLILVDRGRRGTFLPMVWESLPEPRDFWAQLKRKAGLPVDHWSETLGKCALPRGSSSE